MSVSLDINESSIVIATSPSPPAGMVTYPYPGYVFTASGGSPPYTWQASGALPPGLVLGSDGTMSGTPTKIGSYSFSVTATDSAQTPVHGAAVSHPDSNQRSPHTHSRGHARPARRR